jgi:DNA repair protein RadD
MDWIVGELPTGAGKSWICVAIAAACRRLTYFYTKEVVRSLVLTPSGELSDQNCDKMIEAGLEAGIVSASLDREEVDKDIVVGTFQSVANKLDEILEHGPIGSVIIDEAHEDYKVAREIVAKLQQHHPNLRVIGLTATPYSKANGYIYRQNLYDKWPEWTSEFTREPRYKYLFFRISADRLIAQGYLIPGVIGVIAQDYDTDKLKMVNGEWTKESVEQVFGRKQGNMTKAIIKDVKVKTKELKSVLIYCQNRALMREALSFLPRTQAAAIDSHTPKEERAEIIARFKAGKLKYLVNVLALKRGFDAPRVTGIVLMMASESPAKITQILGRGTRLCPEIGKREFLILDYGRNIRRLFPDGNIFNPVVRVGRQQIEGPVITIKVTCPTCAHINNFKPVELSEGMEIDTHGFIVDTASGQHVLNEDGDRVPGHVGIQCTRYIREAEGARRCDFHWSYNECIHCDEPLAANETVCPKCGKDQSGLELDTESDLLADSAYAPKLAHVHKFRYQKVTTRKGKEMIRLDLSVQEAPYKTLNDDGQVCTVSPGIQFLKIWLGPSAANERAQSQWVDFCLFVFEQEVESIHHAVNTPPINIPKSIEYIAQPNQDPQSNFCFYEVRQYKIEPLLQTNTATVDQPIAQISFFDNLLAPQQNKSS